MRKLVSLVCVLVFAGSLDAGILPSWESKSKKFGFYPITNEVTLFRSFDDSGKDRGHTIQIISINTFKLFTAVNFEFTADYNYNYTAGLAHDYYIEVGFVKHFTDFFSINVQRVLSTFEKPSISQYGIRFSF